MLWHRRIRRKVKSLLPSLEVTSASSNSTCSFHSPGVHGSLSCLLQQVGSTLLALEGICLPKCMNTLSPHQPHAHWVPLLRTLLSGRVKTKCSFVLSPTPHGAFPWGKGCFLLAGECQCKHQHQCAVEFQAEKIHARCAPIPYTHTSDGVRKNGMGCCSPCGLEWRKTLIFHQESTGSSPVCRAASTTPQTT